MAVQTKNRIVVDKIVIGTPIRSVIVDAPPPITVNLNVDNVSGDGFLAYDSDTSTIAYYGPSDSDIRSKFSATGDLFYDSATGVFSYSDAAAYTKTNFDSDFTDATIHLQVSEAVTVGGNYNIQTSSLTTNSLNEVVVDTFLQTDFLSCRYTVQASNNTNLTGHSSELLLLHDKWDRGLTTEYGSLYTGLGPEFTARADVLGTPGNGAVRLLITPTSSGNMEFRIIRHTVTA